MNKKHIPDTVRSDIKISVVVPTYNRQQSLRKTIQSVIKQTYPVSEIIVIDDGSDDGTAEMIASEFPFITYEFQPNHGVSSARNKGIQKAKYPWIAFLDSDDEWLSHKIETQITALQYTENYKICHCDEIWIRHGRRVNPKKIHRKYGGNIFARCLPLCVISPSAVLIHHSVFNQIGLFDVSMPVCEDYDLWLRICAKYQVLYIEKKLLKKYGGHTDQLSQKYWGMDRFRIYSIEKILNLGVLNAQQRFVAMNEIVKKINIYINGAKKRLKHDEVLLYKQKYQYYMNQLVEELNHPRILR